MTGYVGMMVEGCGHVVIPSPGVFEDWFYGRDVACAYGCGVYDYWSTVRRNFVGVGRTFSAFAPLGGQMIVRTETLTANEWLLVDLREVIPAKARIRRVNLTTMQSGEDGLLMALAHAENQAYPAPVYRDLRFFGGTQGKSAPASVPLNVFVEYLVAPVAVSGQLLADAVEAQSNGDYRKALIEAHTASDIDAIVTLEGRVAADMTRMSLPTKVAVIEALLTAHSGSALPEQLKDAVRMLNQGRNAVAHPSRKDAPTEESTADCLTGAVFLSHWLELARHQLLTERA